MSEIVKIQPCVWCGYAKGHSSPLDCLRALMGEYDKQQELLSAANLLNQELEQANVLLDKRNDSLAKECGMRLARQRKLEAEFDPLLDVLIREAPHGQNFSHSAIDCLNEIIEQRDRARAKAFEKCKAIAARCKQELEDEDFDAREDLAAAAKIAGQATCDEITRSIEAASVAVPVSPPQEQPFTGFIAFGSNQSASAPESIGLRDEIANRNPEPVPECDHVYEAETWWSVCSKCGEPRPVKGKDEPVKRTYAEGCQCQPCKDARTVKRQAFAMGRECITCREARAKVACARCGGNHETPIESGFYKCDQR